VVLGPNLIAILVTSALDSEIYRRFMEWVLSDEATRWSQVGRTLVRGQRRDECVDGRRQRVPLIGRHIAYTGRERFRGSDKVLRLALAVAAGEAYHRERTGTEHGANWKACITVAELESERTGVSCGRRGPKRKPIPAIPPASPDAHIKPLIPERRDPRFAELDAAIAAEKQRRSASRPSPEVERFARNVKKRVDQFRVRNRDVDLNQLFRGWFALFRFERHRDSEWYTEQEPIYRARIEQVEEYMDPAEGRTRPEPPRGADLMMWEQAKANGMCTRKSDLARAVVNLARLYHEQGKYLRATAQYEQALVIYKSAALPEWLRNVAVCWIPAQIANCKVSKAPDPAPSGPPAASTPNSQPARRPECGEPASSAV
jgi:hypothetical protein